MKFRYKLVLFIAVVIAAFGYGRCGRGTSPTAVTKSAAVLPKNDIEQILVNPSNHHIELVTKTGVQVLTLPDRDSVIDVHTDGTVKVTSPQFGLERHLFAGPVISDHTRVGIGGDFFYYKKLDLGLGVADQLGAYTPVGFVKVTYNVIGNLQVGLNYQTNKYIGAIISVRLF